MSAPETHVDELRESGQTQRILDGIHVTLFDDGSLILREPSRYGEPPHSVVLTAPQVDSVATWVLRTTEAFKRGKA